MVGRGCRSLLLGFPTFLQSGPFCPLRLYGFFSSVLSRKVYRLLRKVLVLTVRYGMVVGILRTLIDVPKAALHTFFKVGSKVCPRAGTPAHVSFVKVVVASEVKQVLASCSCRDRTGEGLRGNRVLRDRLFFPLL